MHGIPKEDMNAWFSQATIKAIKGDIKKALSDLEKAIETGGEAYADYAKECPGFDHIRNNEGFNKLIKSNVTSLKTYRHTPYQ
jgi:hypothetical protein